MRPSRAAASTCSAQRPAACCAALPTPPPPTSIAPSRQRSTASSSGAMSLRWSGPFAAQGRGDPAQQRRRVGDARRANCGNPVTRWGATWHRGRADRVLRRAGDRDEGRIDPDGPGRGQLLRARTARGGGAHRAVQSSVHVRRRQGRRAAGRGQRGDDQAAGAVAAVRAASRRTARRRAAARRVQRRSRAVARPAHALAGTRTSPWWR